MYKQQNLPTQYRLGVGVMLINSDKKVFVGQRVDRFSDAWQMPQGGINEGEDPLAAALRELEEETGINDVEVVAQTADWINYDLPRELIPELWGGKYKGQKQLWYLMRINGGDDKINLQTEVPEFVKWKWVEPSVLPDIIVEFKKDLYSFLVNYFQPFIDKL